MNYNINSFTQPNGTRVLETSSPNVGGPDTSAYTQFMEQLMRAQADQARKDRMREAYESSGRGRSPLAAGRPVAPGMSSPGAEDGRSVMDKQLEFSQKLAALQQSQALTRTPPLKMTYVPNDPSGGGYTMDTNAMTGMQRQIYMPQSATDITRPDFRLWK